MRSESCRSTPLFARWALPAAPAAALLTVLLCAPVIGAQSDSYSVHRDATAPVAGATSVRIENGSGHLVVTGKAGAPSVSASALIKGSSQKLVNSIKVTIDREGDVLVVRAAGPDRGWLSWRDGWSTDLTVAVPNNVKLDVHTGSGGARVENVASVAVRAGSGGVHVDGVSGTADIRSGSGGAEVRNVHGDALVSTGSGGITLAGVTGSVDVRSAGSGGVNARQIGGSLHIGSIGSGGVTVDNIGGDFTIDHKGSGSVRYTNVKGRVDVPRRHGDG
ncbi:MAG: DUF2807 domain-containing protein [Gemmatimonadaceae bacterium]